MVRQPAYLINLKAFAKRRWPDDDAAVASAMNLIHEESDRGAIILAATTLEDMLEFKIVEKMPTLHTDETARKQIFEQDGPISSFSRKILIAYAMGIIDQPYRKRIDLIRELRNACAHARNPVSVSTPEIMAVCEVLLKDVLAGLVDRAPATIRNALLIEIAMLTHYVVSGEKIETVEDRWQHYIRTLRDA